MVINSAAMVTKDKNYHLLQYIFLFFFLGRQKDATGQEHSTVPDTS